jgi:hypothetical protein
MPDSGEADDTITAILENDPFGSEVNDLSELPDALISRMRHYFLTYKLDPEEPADVSIGEAYGLNHPEKGDSISDRGLRERVRRASVVRSIFVWKSLCCTEFAYS